MGALDQAYEIGEELGLDRAAVDKVVARRGSPALAKRALQKRLSTAKAKAQREYEERLAEERAAEAHARHAQRQAEFRADRRQARQAQPLGARLDAAVGQLMGLSTVSPATSQPGAGKPESKPPPPADTPSLSWRLALIRWHVEALEQELDCHRGLDLPVALDGQAKDHIIIHRFRGVHAKELADSVPELGSRRTIERARERAGLRPVNGLPRLKTP